MIEKETKPYIATYKEKKIKVYSDNIYHALLEAGRIFKIKRVWKIDVAPFNTIKLN